MASQSPRSLFLKVVRNVVALRVTKSLSAVGVINATPAWARTAPAVTADVEYIGPTVATASLAAILAACSPATLSELRSS